MANIFTVLSTTSTQVTGPATITNGSGVTAYYRTNNDSIPTVADSSLASGATIRSDVPLWFSSASSSLLVTSDLDPVYTQTYSTASRTHANVTATTAPAGGTGATAGAYDTANNRDAMIASLTATQADLLNLKQVVNAVIDDLQARSLAR
jgi:hypothetical protein